MSFVLLGILTSQAAAVAFDPASLNPDLWLDAADASTITESGGSVSQWNNKGTLENLTQASSANQPTTGANTVNGLNVIDFAGDYLEGSSKNQWKFMHDGTNYFVATVMKFGVTASPSAFYGLIGNNQVSSANTGFSYGWDDRLNQEGPWAQVTNGSGSPVFVRQEDNFIFANTIFVNSFLVDPDNATAADRFDHFVNTTENSVQNTSTDSPSSSDPNLDFVLGTVGANTFPLTGQIAEIIIVSGVDATEENRVEVVNYLNAKWSVF